MLSAIAPLVAQFLQLGNGLEISRPTAARLTWMRRARLKRLELRSSLDGAFVAAVAWRPIQPTFPSREEVR